MFSFDSSLDSVKPTFAFSKVCCVDGYYLLLMLSGPLRLPLVLNFPGCLCIWGGTELDVCVSAGVF